jgi:hypothetical protein
MRLPELVHLYDMDADVIRWWRARQNQFPQTQFVWWSGFQILEALPRLIRPEVRCLVYCDPPYPLETRKSGARYQNEFSSHDHANLLCQLQTLNVVPSDRRPLMMISSYWSEQYAKALSDWRHFSFRAQTRRGMATEHVWCNYDEPHQLQDYRYLGRNKRERFKLERRRRNLIGKLTRMPELERNALLSAMMDEFSNGKESR